MTENPFTPENGWTFKPLTLKRSDLVKLAGVFAEIHGPDAKVAIIRDLRAAVKNFIPVEDNGIQAMADDGDEKPHWFLRDLVRAVDAATSK